VLYDAKSLITSQHTLEEVMDAYYHAVADRTTVTAMITFAYTSAVAAITRARRR
jgi:hypothetical protein